MDEDESFVNLEIPKINFAEDKVRKNYIIYTNQKDYITVEAMTAHEALEKENINSPYKIVIPKDRSKFIITNHTKPQE